jgi:hypothetical protein
MPRAAGVSKDLLSFCLRTYSSAILSIVTIFLSLLGIVASFVLIWKRQLAGDMLGEAQWMKKIGGVYNVIIIVAILIFFWSVAELTGTAGFLFSPVRYLLPGLSQPQTGF